MLSSHRFVALSLPHLALAFSASYALQVNAQPAATAAQGSVGSELNVGADAAPPSVGADSSAPADSTPDAVRGREHGFEYGLRLGLELPVGSIDAGGSVLNGGVETRSGDLSGVALARVPVALDLGYRFSPRWWLGVDAAVGLGPVGEDCPDDAQCEWSTARLAAQALLTLAPQSSLRPWLGASLGYEWLSGSVSQAFEVGGEGDAQTAAVRAQESLSGPVVSLQGGLQFEVGDQLRLGPYASAAAGVYLLDTYECPSALACPDSGATEDPGVHAWLGLGIRGTHGP